MATRFYFRENGTAPITPAVDAAWESSAAPFARAPMFTTTEAGDTVTTVAGFTSTAGQDRCHRQWISEPMAAGKVFDTSVTYKCYLACRESAANDNLTGRTCLRILSEDGSTVRHTILALANYGSVAEWSTVGLVNRAFINGDAGTGSYTTVANDRLVLELGHADSGGVSIEGRSAWGSDSGAASDHGENDTDAVGLRPWFETSLDNLFGAPPAEEIPILVARRR